MTTRRGMSRHHHAGPSVVVGPQTPVVGPATPAARPLWWRELLLVILGYWLYTLVRNAVPDQAREATENAERLQRLERAISVDVELAINLAIDRVSWLIVGMNYFYAVAHFVATISVLVWLYRRRPRHYRPARNVFLITNAVALMAFYLYPLAPPRLLPGHGYVDTVISHGTWGSWASGDVAAASNQYAAMPSMHVAWSLFCAAAIVLLARRRWVRVAGALHPVLTLVVIVATANHFVLDAVGGVAALAAGFAIPRTITALRQRPARRGPARRHPGSDDELAAAQREPVPAGVAEAAGAAGAATIQEDGDRIRLG